MNFARRVAEAILNEAQSGSAVWDELGGPEATLVSRDGKYVMTIPGGWDEQGNRITAVCRVTVEMEQ